MPYQTSVNAVIVALRGRAATSGPGTLGLADEDKPPGADGDRRTIRRILVLVVAGWLFAVALMVVAALFWDRG